MRAATLLSRARRYAEHPLVQGAGLLWSATLLLWGASLLAGAAVYGLTALDCAGALR